MCVIKHTLVGTVYRQEEDSKMKSAVFGSVEVLQTITAQAVQEPEEEDVRAVTQKNASKNSRLEGLTRCFLTVPVLIPALQDSVERMITHLSTQTPGSDRELLKSCKNHFKCLDKIMNRLCVYYTVYESFNT